jgi:hypothetical protein
MSTNVKKLSTPQIIEQHPKDYTGFPFITLIQYHKSPLLCIIDNATDGTIQAFVLDMCGPANINEEMVVVAAQEWYENESKNYPISIYFSKLGIASSTSKIYRTINIEYVSRAIGPVPKYPMATTKSIKRRRRKPISPSVQISQSGNITELNS